MKNFILESLVQGLGWTLLHSLWIGVITAAITGLIILLTRRSSAQLRYRLLTANLCLFILAMGFVFLNQLPQSPASAPNQFDQYSATPGAVITAGQFSHVNWIGLLNVIIPYIVSLWLVVFLLKSARMLIRSMGQRTIYSGTGRDAGT
jgi:bla regulator protein blaR1